MVSSVINAECSVSIKTCCLFVKIEIALWRNHIIFYIVIIILNIKTAVYPINILTVCQIKCAAELFFPTWKLIYFPIRIFRHFNIIKFSARVQCYWITLCPKYLHFCVIPISACIPYVETYILLQGLWTFFIQHIHMCYVYICFVIGNSQLRSLFNRLRAVGIPFTENSFLITLIISHNT